MVGQDGTGRETIPGRQSVGKSVGIIFGESVRRIVGKSVGNIVGNRTKLLKLPGTALPSGVLSVSNATIASLHSEVLAVR